MDHNFWGENCECPIWGTTAHKFPTNDRFYVFYSARAGGYFAITMEAKNYLPLLDTDVKIKLSRHICNLQYNIIKENLEEDCRRYMLNSKIIDSIKNDKFLSYTLKKEAFFKFLINEGVEIGVDFSLVSENVGLDKYDRRDRLLAATELENGNDKFVKFCRLLGDEGLLKINDDFEIIKLTHKAYEYIEKLQTDHIDSKNAFVAMWFSDETKQFYNEGVEIALENCGYEKPFRVDKKHHINKIDDEIVAMIRKSRLVIVDMTCGTVKKSDDKLEAIPRGGVYYEAGFAQGLDRPVIWTCNKDCLSHLHFDIRQYNMLRWHEKSGQVYLFDDNSEDEILFSKALENRISALNLNLKKQ